jgi:hypothetical protein
MKLFEEADEGGAGGSGGDSISPQQEQQARQLGWVPQDEWKGASEKWQPADKFLERGEEIMPILKANNRRLSQQLSSQGAQVTALQQQIAEQNEVLSALKESNDEIAKERKEGQIRDLTEQIKTARTAEDVGLESRLQARLTNLTREVEEEEEVKPVKKPVPVNPAAYLETEWWQGWQADNSWYGQDKDKTELADIISIRMRQNPATANLKDREFLDKMTTEVSRLTGANLNGSRARAKVEGSGNRGGSGGGVDDSRYSDLPTSAKEQCARQVKKLVGTKPGQFKTERDYQIYYAKMYFGKVPS